MMCVCVCVCVCMLCATRVSIGWDNFTLYHPPEKTDGCRMGRDYRVHEEGKKLVITLEHIIRLPGLKIFSVCHLGLLYSILFVIS
jgi:hypothetical protein